VDETAAVSDATTESDAAAPLVVTVGLALKLTAPDTVGPATEAVTRLLGEIAELGLCDRDVLAVPPLGVGVGAALVGVVAGLVVINALPEKAALAVRGDADAVPESALL